VNIVSARNVATCAESSSVIDFGIGMGVRAVSDQLIGGVLRQRIDDLAEEVNVDHSEPAHLPQPKPSKRSQQDRRGRCPDISSWSRHTCSVIAT
jgi:hypothetical protein